MRSGCFYHMPVTICESQQVIFRFPLLILIIFLSFFSVSYCPIGSPDPSSECIGEKSVWNTTGEEVTITGLQPWTYYKVISYAEIVIYL